MANVSEETAQNAGGDAVQSPTDRALLERFLRHRDEAAFAALVQRHSRTVWGVCRRVLQEELGWKPGTVSGRLADARKMLQQGLARRGVTLTAVMMTVALSSQSASAAPAALVQVTAQAVLAGKGASLSSSAVALAQSSWSA